MFRILLWGTGTIASNILSHLSYNNVDVIGIIDTYKKEETWRKLPVYLPEKIECEYDLIIVANSFTEDIVKICQKEGIDKDKLVFFRVLKYNPGFSDLETIKLLFDEEIYTHFCIEYGKYEKSFVEYDAVCYSALNKRESFKINKENIWPVLRDKYSKAGCVNNYFQQDLWAARHIYKSGVKNHFDIGSRLDGFIAHLLSMEIKVTMIDVREFPGEIDGLDTIVADATMLDGIEDESIDSLSALCSLEHFGLGRYGDPIDPEACFKCFNSITRKMKSGGRLYISVPVGQERVEFNAHRVFYPQTVIDSFDNFSLIEFSCVTAGKIEYNVAPHKYDDDRHNGDYRYGLFHFIKQ